MRKELNEIIRIKIGERIRKVREKKNLSLRELEAITGIGHSWIGKLENGKINFQIDSLIQLMQALQIQPRDLFNYYVEYPDND